MSEPVPPSVRAADRSRRIGDAARALPLVGLVLMALPVLGTDRSGISVWLYLFGLWVALILAASVLARRLPEDEAPDPDPGAP